MATAPQRLTLLVLSELGGQILRVNRLCEQLVRSATGGAVDAVLVSGGLVAPRALRAYDALESVAAAEGDMMALVARLESIVCRVLYIPDDNDPPTTRSLAVAPPALTQYSANVFAREAALTDGVVAMGEARYFALLNDGKDPTDGHDLVLVLRDSAARSPLPAPHVREGGDGGGEECRTGDERSFPIAAQVSEEDLSRSRYLEIVGGGHHPPHANAPLVFPGSFRTGEFTILELEKRRTDGSWHIATTTAHQALGLEDGDMS